MFLLTNLFTFFQKVIFIQATTSLAVLLYLPTFPVLYVNELSGIVTELPLTSM